MGAYLRVSEFSTLGSPGRSQVSTSHPRGVDVHKQGYVYANFHLKRTENDKLAWRIEVMIPYEDNLPTRLDMTFNLLRQNNQWDKIRYENVTLVKDRRTWYSPWLETFSYQDVINNSAYYNKDDDSLTHFAIIKVWRKHGSYINKEGNFVLNTFY